MMDLERVWYGESRMTRFVRAALAPPALVYAAVVEMRGALYARGILRSHAPAIPVLSLGNLSVGGTGKTPMSAWAAQRLRTLGGHPAIVLRGYGEDEPLVHAALNSDVPVVVNADRVQGAARARELGADCAILDDGFQHRRLHRTADWVLVSAEQYRPDARLLPAGPLREPTSALARADVVIITRKSADPGAAASLAEALGLLTPRAGIAICHLAPNGLVDARSGVELPLTRLHGTPVVAVAAIGAPGPFFAQLRESGVTRLHEVAMRDHHRFTPADVERLVRLAPGVDAVVCTLKDAVKLAPLWPNDSVPLWYVSQRVVVERGGPTLDASLAAILAARANISSTAGATG